MRDDDDLRIDATGSDEPVPNDGRWHRDDAVRRSLSGVKEWEGELTVAAGSSDSIGIEAARQFLTRSSDLLGIVDTDGNFKWANPAMVHHTGIAQSELLNSSILTLLHPDDRPRFANLLQSNTDLSPVESMELRLRRADGVYTSVAWSLEKETGGEDYLISGRDTTERKRVKSNTAFLDDVSRDLVGLTTVQETMNQLGEKIGTYFDAKFVTFAEVDSTQEIVTVNHAWNYPGLPSLRGVYRISNFHTEAFLEAGQAGETYVVRDVANDPRANAEAILPLNIESFVSVPLLRDGRWLFLLAVYDSVPREWREDEISLIRDLTTRIWGRLERSRAENELRDSEERYRNIFHAIDEGFVISELQYDEHGRPVDLLVLQTNPRFDQMMRTTDAVGKRARQIFPNAEDSWFEAYGQVVATGESLRFENYLGALDSWFELYISRIGGQGSHRFAIVFNDITERKRAGAAFSENQQRQEYLLELNDALRHLMNPTEIQGVAARLLGEWLGASRTYYVEYDEDEGYATVERDYVADGSPSLVGRYDREAYGTVLSRIGDGRTWIVDDVTVDREIAVQEREALAAQGVIAWIDVPLVKQQKLVAVLCLTQTSARNWTKAEVALVEETAERTWSAVERARTEVELRDSRERLQLALNASAMGTFIWHPENDLCVPDRRLLELFGLPVDGTISLATAVANLIHPDDGPGYVSAVEQSLDPRGTGVLNTDIRVILPDGSVRWLAIYGQVSFGGTPPRALRMAGMATNITARKMIEAQHASARELAEKAVRARDEFLAIASHELRNPLATIRGNVQLMQRAAARGQLDELRLERYTKTINLASERLTVLVDDLLDVSRLTSGQWRMRKQPVELADLVREAILSEQIARSQHRLQIDIQPGPPLELDPDRIRQVIVNLVDNAFKYSSAGSEVRILLRNDPEGALLEVSDRGIGLPNDALESIFEPFGRASNAVSSSIPGMGLGLYVCFRIAQAHQGRLWAESAGEGLGTTMYLRLPGSDGRSHA